MPRHRASQGHSTIRPGASQTSVHMRRSWGGRRGSARRWSVIQRCAEAGLRRGPRRLACVDCGIGSLSHMIRNAEYTHGRLLQTSQRRDQAHALAVPQSGARGAIRVALGDVLVPCHRDRPAGMGWPPDRPLRPRHRLRASRPRGETPRRRTRVSHVSLGIRACLQMERVDVPTRRSRQVGRRRARAGSPAPPASLGRSSARGG